MGDVISPPCALHNTCGSGWNVAVLEDSYP